MCDLSLHVSLLSSLLSLSSWSYGSWIYNYLCNQCLTPLKLWVRISIRARCATLCDKVCQWLVTGQWFSLCTPVSSTNKTDRHDITEILLKVALNTITLTPNQWKKLKQKTKTRCFFLKKDNISFEIEDIVHCI
jgi:hypothetical protein